VKSLDHAGYEMGAGVNAAMAVLPRRFPSPGALTKVPGGYAVRDIPRALAHGTNYGISYTMISVEMPRKAARCSVGCKPEFRSTSATFGASNTDLVTRIARDEARSWTRAAIFTVCPK